MAEAVQLHSPIELGFVPISEGRFRELPALPEPDRQAFDPASLIAPFHTFEKSRYERDMRPGDGRKHPAMYFRVGDKLISYGCSFDRIGRPDFGVIQADHILAREPNTTSGISTNLISAYFGDRGQMDFMQLQWYDPGKSGEVFGRRALPMTEIVMSKDYPAGLSLSSSDILGGEPIDMTFGETVHVEGAAHAYRVDHAKDRISVARLHLDYPDALSPVIISVDVAVISDTLEGISGRLRDERSATEGQLLDRYPVGVAFGLPPAPTVVGFVA